MHCNLGKTKVPSVAYKTLHNLALLLVYHELLLFCLSPSFTHFQPAGLSAVPQGIPDTSGPFPLSNFLQGSTHLPCFFIFFRSVHQCLIREVSIPSLFQIEPAFLGIPFLYSALFFSIKAATIWQTVHLIYVIIYFPSLEGKLHKGRDFFECFVHCNILHT